MDERVRALARDLGADFITDLPDVGHGALGAAHYAAYYRRRLAELRDQEDSEQFLQLPVKRSLVDALDQIAEAISDEGHQLTRADVALVLLFDAAARALNDWAGADDENDKVSEVHRLKNQIDKAKLAVCQSLGLTPKRSAAG